MLQRAREAYERYLALLDNYGMLSKGDKKLQERYVDNRDEFSLMSMSDPTARRDTKITRLKQEKELELKLEVGLSSGLRKGTASHEYLVSRSSTHHT